MFEFILCFLLFWIELFKAYSWVFILYNRQHTQSNTSIFIIFFGYFLSFVILAVFKSSLVLIPLVFLEIITFYFLTIIDKKFLYYVIDSFVSQEPVHRIVPIIYGSIIGLTIIEINNSIQADASFLYFPFLLLLIVIVYFFYKEKTKNRNNKYYLIIISWSIFIFIVTRLLLSLQNVSTLIITSSEFIASCMLLLLYIIINYLYIYVQKKKNQYKDGFQLYESLYERQQEYYEDLLKRDNETRMFRHDMKSHIQMLKSLHESGEISKMIEYIDAIDERIKAVECRLLTGNSIVDIVAQDILSRYKDMNLHWQGQLPSQMCMETIDTCILFSNIMKNAAEHSQYINEKKEVFVEVTVVDSHIVLRQTNEYEYHENHLLSKKKDALNHGFGISNIKTIVNKYNGSCLFKLEEQFVLEIILHNMI